VAFSPAQSPPLVRIPIRLVMKRLRAWSLSDRDEITSP
jgi:hypothetical protein